MWVAIINVASWIWHGIHAAADAVVAWLVPLVKWLWNAALVTGKLIGAFGKRVWSFMRATWDHVLVPAWQKFAKFVTDVHGWLERHLAPALRKINWLRTKVGGFWKAYVRPILDLLDITRGFLQILARLGVDWARKLDAELARIESLIAKPFLEFNRRLNEVGNWINRIVDLDGLYQRVVLLKSLIRDAKFAGNIWWNTVHRKSTEAERATATEKPKRKTIEVHTAELRDAVARDDGPIASRIAEEVADMRAILQRV